MSKGFVRGAAGTGVAVVLAGCVSSPPPARVTASVCDGLSPTTIESVAPTRGQVEPLEEEVGKQHLRTLRGVRLTLPPQDGVDVSSVRHRTACRLSQSPSLALTPEEREGVVVRAREVERGVEVTISSEDIDVARRIVASERPKG